MTKKKLVTFKDYINALKRLQKVAHDLEDIDNEMGGQLSGMDTSDSDKERKTGHYERLISIQLIGVD